jgi:hypothetical protein
VNIRECNQCHKMVDFDEPWCDHETMEESAWRDIQARGLAFGVDAALIDELVDNEVNRAAKKLGLSAGKAIGDKIKEDLDK